MAIKTTGTGSALRIITKTVDGEVRVSCECCCFCSNYDLDDVLYGNFDPDNLGDGSFPILIEECGDFSAFEAIKPEGTGIDMKQACLRWLCRQTILTESGPQTISNPIGGPTTNDRDLNDIILECLGEREGEEFAGLANGASGVPPEEYSVCYLYAFEFFGWQKRGRTIPPVQDPIWVSSDIIVTIYRRDDPL